MQQGSDTVAFLLEKLEEVDEHVYYQVPNRHFLWLTWYTIISSGNVVGPPTCRTDPIGSLPLVGWLVVG